MKVHCKACNNILTRYELYIDDELCTECLFSDKFNPYTMTESLFNSKGQEIDE